MFISDIFKHKSPVFSFEIFPPKNTTSIDSIYQTIDALAPLGPDFISVTYGAGGSSRDNTVEIASLLKTRYNIPALAHLTCIGASKDSIDEILTRLEKAEVHNILALRGDVIGEKDLNDFNYASDLIKYIKKRENFSIAGACYPHKHPEAYSIEEDIKHLKEKVDLGTDVLISQLFFDNETFYKWKEAVRQKGINIPISAGIMPITSAKQLERMVSMCGAHIPNGLQNLVRAYNKNSQALKEAGITYATMQIIDLLASGVEGIHLYTMNQPEIAKRIMENMRGILYSVKAER